jgi:amino-acid N-acetyltransferase
MIEELPIASADPATSMTFTTRRAQLSDVPRMMPLLEAYARQAEILPRSAADVYQSIREWVVAEAGGEIVGMGSLLILWQDLAEVRSLVVAPAWQGYGVGRSIVAMLLAEAEMLQLPRVFALTRRAGFFLKLGFHLTQKELLPRKVMKDCVICPKFHACDEIAVVLDLAPLNRTVTTSAAQLSSTGPTIPLIPVEIAPRSNL